ncbi:MAG: hypothetical protein WKF40_05625 [Thermoleophilaceae bacterium]
MTKTLIIIAVIVVIAIIVFLLIGRQAKAKRDEKHRGEALEHREEAKVRTARADSKEAEAEEQAAVAKREQARAEEQRTVAERERRAADDRHDQADRLDPDVDHETRREQRDGNREQGGARQADADDRDTRR